MKTSFILTSLILAAAVVIGWRDHQRLAAMRVTYTHAVTEATKRGISIEPTTDTADARVTKRARENRDATAKILATDFIEFSKEKETLRSKRIEPDEAFQARELDLQGRMASLDSAQWKILIAEVGACQELKDRTRQAFFYNAITTFARKHPQAALDFLATSPDLFKRPSDRERLISMALPSWARENPLAAIQWFRENRERFPDSITEETKIEMVEGAATQDPSIAFSFIHEVDPKWRNRCVSQVIYRADTPEKRSATLDALRGFVASIKDEKSRDEAAFGGIGAFATNVCQLGFNPATQWAESAELTPAELKSFCSGLSTIFASDPPLAKPEETGQWIEWVGKTRQVGNSDVKVRIMVSQWTLRDPRSAAQWLGNVPDGALKNLSVQVFAETVAPFDPEIATQWAMTLPPGKERDSTIKSIHVNWPKDDAIGKEAFAKEHAVE